MAERRIVAKRIRHHLARIVVINDHGHEVRSHVAPYASTPEGQKLKKKQKANHRRVKTCRAHGFRAH